MTRGDLLCSIVADLGANYREWDSDILGALLDEVINDALLISNRHFLVRINGEVDESKVEDQLDLLSSEIRKCVKSLYLQRGSEDVNSQSLSGLSSQYDDAKARLRQDIILNSKRIML